jgi:hypothetical protein
MLSPFPTASAQRFDRNAVKRYPEKALALFGMIFLQAFTTISWARVFSRLASVRPRRISRNTSAANAFQ